MYAIWQLEEFDTYDAAMLFLCLLRVAANWKSLKNGPVTQEKLERDRELNLLEAARMLRSTDDR